MNNKIKLDYSSSLTELLSLNSSFDSGKLRIAYTGKNRNNSFISKKSFERAIPTMFGCPVVANYIRCDNEIGSHDGEIIKGVDGELKYVNITEPIGFLPPGAEWNWEIIDDDGEIHEYLVSEVLLWKRQEAYSKIKENGITSQSMEISVIEGNMENGYYNISDFEFTAFCLLGTAEPCFESAALISYSVENYVEEQLSAMYEEFKLVFSNDERFKIKEEAGENNMKLEELLAKYSVSVEDLEFDTDGLSDEELEEKFAEAFSESEADDDSDPYNGDVFTLDSQLFNSLCEQISSKENILTEWGDCPRYYMVDYDSSVAEVYYSDRIDGTLYGATYSMNGDNVVIDFETQKRKRFAIVDFDEGQEAFNLKDYADSLIENIKSGYESKYNQLKADYDLLLCESNKKAATELIDKFESKLSGEPEFEALKKNISKIENVDDLENKLFAIVGKKQFEFISDNSKKSLKVGLVVNKNDKDESDPYGDLFNWKK
ncbi:hypothetical protein AALA22_08895 [Anaerovoracaceae bacterium 41-7]